MLSVKKFGVQQPIQYLEGIKKINANIIDKYDMIA